MTVCHTQRRDEQGREAARIKAVLESGLGQRLSKLGKKTTPDLRSAGTEGHVTLVVCLLKAHLIPSQEAVDALQRRYVFELGAQLLVLLRVCRKHGVPWDR